MPQCIFCLEEKERLTEEHVFPAALGGVLVLNDSACHECNNGFSKFEQPLVAELSPIRLLLKIPDRYGKLPQVAAIVKTQDKDYEGRVKGDGSVQLKRIVTEAIGPDGRREFLHQFLTVRQRNKLQQEAMEKGLQIIESGPGDPQQAEVHVGGDLKFFGRSEGLRTVSKIAYVGLAERAGAKIATSDAFSEVRAYVLEEKGKPPSRLFVHKGFMQAVQQGPHQHSLIIAARHDKGRVDSIVRLFGGLCYFVQLSDHYDGADFFATLVYDAHRGETNGVLQSHVDAEMLQTEDVATSDQAVWGDPATSGQFFCNFLEAAIQSKIARERGRRLDTEPQQ
jgi:hypothetical protein